MRWCLCVVLLYDAEMYYAVYYGSGVRGDGHGNSRDYFYAWSFIFPDRDVGYTTVKEDNKGAIYLANNPVTTPNSKHIDVRHHFFRERVADQEFQIVHVPSEEQHVDFLTKPLDTEAFRFHRNFVMNLW